MRRNDIFLIVLIVLVAAGGLAAFFLVPSQVGHTAVVSFFDTSGETEIMRIDLTDGSYRMIDASFVFYPDADEDDDVLKRCFKEGENVYCVTGLQGVVVIEYLDHKIRVIEETSDYNICRYQGDVDGFTNSPYHPLTCLPNHIRIRIEAEDDDDDNDFVS